MKVKLIIPDSLKDIKLSTYQKFISQTKPLQEDLKDLEDVEKINEITKQINKIAVMVFCNLDEDLVSKLAAKDYEKLIKQINLILNTEEEFKTTFYYNGVKYGFIPNLQDITVGEEADAESFMKDPKDWHKLMKVIYRPIEKEHKGKYTIKEYTGKEDELDLPMSIVNPSVNFFLNTLKDLLNCIPNYTTKLVKQNKKLLNLVENGDGIQVFTDSLKEIFSDMSKLAS